MSRAKFEAWSDNRCEVEFDTIDQWGEPKRRHLSLWAPEGGGYVRDLADDQRQPCDGFAARGVTMLWGGHRPLIEYARAEYRRMRAAERREAERF